MTSLDIPVERFDDRKVSLDRSLSSINTLAKSCRDGLDIDRVDAAKANHPGDDALQ